jgi:hypothetical protein
MSDHYYNQDDDKTIFHGPPDACGGEPAEDMALVVEEGRGGRYPLREGGFLTVGRNADQNVALKDARVSREHLVIRRTGFLVRVEVKGRNGLLMDGKTYRDQTIELTSESFQIGKTPCRIESETTVLMTDNGPGMKVPETVFDGRDMFDDAGGSGARDPDPHRAPEDFAPFPVSSSSPKDFEPEIIERSFSPSSPFFHLDVKTACVTLGGVALAILVAVLMFFSPWDSKKPEYSPRGEAPAHGISVDNP